MRNAIAIKNAIALEFIVLQVQLRTLAGFGINSASLEGTIASPIGLFVFRLVNEIVVRVERSFY